MYLPSVKVELYKDLTEAAVDMSLHPDRFPPAIYGQDNNAEFDVTKDYAVNAPWTSREKNKKAPSW